MFSFAAPELPNEKPWDLPLPDRIRMLRKQRTRVAYFYAHPDSSTFRYRAYSMVEALNLSDRGVSASWFHEGDGRHLLPLMREIDVLVLCRASYNSFVDGLASIAHAYGAKVLYDVDDLVFESKYVPLLVSSLDQWRGSSPMDEESMWQFWYGYVGRIRAAMSLADETITTTTLLSAKAEESVGKRSWIVPNFMCQAQIDFSNQLVAHRDATGVPRTESMHLGYFSGTPTHNRDLRVAAPAIMELLDCWPELRVRVVGFIEWERSGFSHFRDRFDFEPLVGFLDLQRLIAETEINLAPLQENVFTNCKSELKYFDAAAVAIPTLASHTSPMAAAIDSGTTGVLVRADEWFDSLNEMVRDYETTGRAIGWSAYRAAHDQYRGAAQVEAVLDALGLR